VPDLPLVAVMGTRPGPSQRIDGPVVQSDGCS